MSVELIAILISFVGIFLMIWQLSQQMNQRFDSLRSELRQEISELKQEFKQDMSELKQEFKQDISELKQEIKILNTRVDRLYDMMVDLHKSFFRRNKAAWISAKSSKYRHLKNTKQLYNV